jgi:hypothetical protein
MKWTKIIMEWVIEKSIVNAEEDCTLLSLWSSGEKGQVEAVYKLITV